MFIRTADNTMYQPNPYANVEKRQTAAGIVKADNAAKMEAEKVGGALTEPHDEYIPRSKKPNEAPGIYRLEMDGDGQQKIVFDRPTPPEKGGQVGAQGSKANENPPEAAPDEVKAAEKSEKKDGVEKSSEKEDKHLTTVNTDKVDAEIKKLKEEKEQIEQQLKSAEDDENKRKDLEKQLLQVEAELSAKDNDAYRKHNSTYTNS